MSLPDVSFDRIRPLDESRHSGFEELCVQLAALEHRPAGATFYRKGRGGDAGVESVRRDSNGKEVGWQAKYAFQWNASLVAQLDDSIKTALAKHPHLIEYVVCLPFDLSDSRTGRGKTAREKWEEWCTKWKRSAKANKRGLKITLWGRSQLIARLTRDDPAHSGRVLYWFGVEALTPSWFDDQFQKAKVSLGSRYTPETNVELPIRRDFLAFTRDPSLQKQIDNWFLRVSDEGRLALDAIRRVAPEGEIHAEQLSIAIQSLATSLGGEPVGPDQLYPTGTWSLLADACLSLARAALRWAYDLPASRPEPSGSTPGSRARYNLQKLIELLYDITEALTSNYWRMTNARAVLLEGSAGIGKSHLLADVVEHQIHAGRVAVLVLGSIFVDDDPWRQILTQLDRPPTEQVKHFLGALDAAAQAAGGRAIICIDALNERNGLDVWPHRLATFLKSAEAFPHIGIVLSCRSTYVPYLIPDDLGQDQLFRVTHKGFAADGAEAAKIYLDKRGIVRPGAPNLVPEFENPLFLKTCCDFLDKQGTTELPRGIRGVTSLFDFYNDAVARSLNRRMKLDSHLNIVSRAIDGFAQLLTAIGSGYAPKNEAIAFFESIHSSQGRLEQSLLSQLESEGVLAIEPVRQVDGSTSAMVRFTFERFSDHTIASRLLDDYLNPADVGGSFRQGQPLQDIVFGERNYQRAGIVEAIAIQLPERTGIELLDVDGGDSFTLHRAFLASLLLREQSHFTDRTFELAKAYMDGSAFNDLLISISTEPNNKFNASYLHSSLMPLPMPERDAFWSIYLAKRGFEGPIDTLISWAIRNGHERIDEDRAYLAATMLTWFLTTSNRIVRDRATKGLACILCRRLPIAVRLLGDFAHVNDIYVFERLLAACYGAALQGGQGPGLSDLADVTFKMVFADGKPPLDALLRDHAQGIIEYALQRDALSGSFDIDLARPPYQSPWPIEPVPDELIESYTEDRGRGVFSDAIVSSTGTHGDFASYQIDSKVGKWSPARIGTTALPTSEDIVRSWAREFSINATEEQRQAFDSYFEAARAARGVPDYQESSEIEHLRVAESTFKATLAVDQWEDFRVRVQGFIRYQLFDTSRPDTPASFNIAWARRWVCKRAHELGWTSKLFGDFDNHQVSDRMDHRIERMGKKYQWIAFRDLIARMADNLAYLGDYFDRDRDQPPAYRGAGQVSLRDIDPSLLTSGTYYDGWREWGKTWWVPFQPQLRSVDARERYAWLESDVDIINDKSLIDLRDPRTGRRWLAYGHFRTGRAVECTKEEKALSAILGFV